MKIFLGILFVISSLVLKVSAQDEPIVVNINEDKIAASEALSRINSTCGTSIDESALINPDAELTVSLKDVSCESAIQLLAFIERAESSKPSD